MATGGNRSDLGEHATKGGNKRDFGEHATKSGYTRRDFGWKQPFLLPISFSPCTHSHKTARSPPNSPRSFKRYIHIHTPFSSARSAKKKMYGIVSSIPFPSARSAEKIVLYTSSARAAYLYVDGMPSVLIRNFCVGNI